MALVHRTGILSKAFQSKVLAPTAALHIISDINRALSSPKEIPRATKPKSDIQALLCQRGFTSESSTSPHVSSQAPPHSREHFERRIVPFSPEQLYSVVSDVGAYHRFVPWCTDSRVIRRVDKTHLIADLGVGFRFLSERYTSVITLDPNRSVSADVPNSNLFEYLVTDWVFEPTSAGDHTNLTFYVEFAFRNPMYRRVTDLFFEEVVRRMVSAFEHRCHLKYHGGENLDSERQRGIFHRW